MQDLRSEVRDAFAKEQAKYPPAANLRHDIVRATALQPRRQRNFQWIAVAAALAIAALVVAGLLSSRLMQRASVPAATPGASPTDDYGPPPAGVNLFYVHDPKHPSWVIGFDWSGKPRATVKLDPEQTNVTMAPDGHSFAVGLNAKGGHWQFFDGVGQLVSTDSMDNVYATMWADDNRHLCAMTQDTVSFAFTLWSLDPGRNPAPVLEVARDTQLGQSGLFLAACSFKNDTAIVYRTVVASATEYWAIRISDGKVLAHRSLPAGVAGIAASPDASLIALNSGTSTGQTSDQAPATVIRRVADDSVMATLDASMGVLGFTGDDSAVLVTLSPWVGGTATHLGEVKLDSATVVWQDTGKLPLGGFVIEPDGAHFVISYWISDQTPGPAEVLIVGADGSETGFDLRYVPTW